MDALVLNTVNRVEKIIVVILLLSLMSVVLYTAVVFLVLLYSGILSSIQNSFMPDNNVLHYMDKIFGGFLSVLIGIELLQTIKMYLKEGVIHAEVVLLVTLIAVSRHIIHLDFEHLDPLMVLSVSSLVVALAAGFYLIKKALTPRVSPFEG